MTEHPLPDRAVSPLDRLLIAALPHRLHIGLTLFAKVRLTPAEALSLTCQQVDRDRLGRPVKPLPLRVFLRAIPMTRLPFSPPCDSLHLQTAA